MSKRFDERADEFIVRVRAAEIGPSTEVWLIYYCIDQNGNELPPIRSELEPSMKVEWPDDAAAAAQFAESLHVGIICDNINSLVRGLGDGLTRLHDGPPNPVYVRDVEIEFVQPTD